MNLLEADRLFATPVRVKALTSVLTDRKVKRISISGITGSAPAMLFAALTDIKKTLLIIADDGTEAGYIYHDICQVLGDDGDVCIFPGGYKRAVKYGQIDPPSQILRTEVLDRLNSRKPPRIIVTSPDALAEKVSDPKALSSNTIKLKTGTDVEMSELVKQLIDLGFNSVEYVYEPGQFARRGSILDIYSFSSELPYRIDFFDTEIDSIRMFNVETQLSESKLDAISIVSGNPADTDSGISLLEFIGSRCVLICRQPEFVVSRVNEIAGFEFSESGLIAGEGDPEAMKKVVNAKKFAEDFNNSVILRYGVQPAPPAFGAEASMEFHCSLQTLYHKNFDLISDSFKKFISEGYRIFILSDSEYQTDRLNSIFKDRGDDIVFTPVGRTVHEGFVDHENKNCFFTDHQIFDRFHNYSLRSDKARAGKLALSIKELNQIETGDFIVHIDHGIGRFGGLVKTDVNGRPQEMIKLFYQNNDLVLVSIHALHKLSKYRAKDGIPPKVSKLGGGSWNRLKERAKTRMKDMARELISLYAARKSHNGYQFSPDSYLQHELEASFIYEDTPDQLKATQAVKKDMEQSKPMDRLICGDVGFGKTEIAIRAAFKAAADGKQTAVLVPTTLLALQHYHTFCNRLKDFPVRVEFISRARKSADVKKVLADLAEGKVDILIGTHKIVGKSVKFKDLGLLVIDEEQKFGVAVKEKLKQLKVNVDTLTMSATPIPRTLQFSLMGARDLSNLNTPPVNRQPILTSVSTLDESVVRDAVEFELSRNGQVFFVSNRIENLNVLEAMLKRVLPDVRVVIAHGQMPPEQLEKAVTDFTNQDYDVLLSTTIVENGIDMPNVNTILVNNAHTFGLSELHQLRGRVGRSDKKAFCYLFVPPGSPLTAVARRRLQAIENFSDLGSGIHIAMQDLDIRGAGNLLGAEQSGFIADLGYEAYQQILKEAVTELKTEEFGDAFEDVSDNTEEFVNDVTIESDLELRLPPQYVPQENERITLYRQLDNMERPEQIEEFRENLCDRFGAIPDVTEELINVVPLRMVAKRLGIERISLKNNVMRLFFVGDDNVAYYRSQAFGRVLTYLRNNFTGCSIRETPATATTPARRLMIVDNVPAVSRGLEILRTIETLDPS
ncbi:MAG: transcription-repair coupling factor [Candidatus Amulumruptor caecigallinarius]|nr:transcription-repair coupling factor [Candidatus Amulumruptor caecigallinarius]